MFALSIFGMFLGLGFLASLFTIWRLSQAYDLDPETVTNLSLAVLIGVLIGARLWFVLGELTFFNSLERIFLINRYPGLSFWGGFVSGSVTFWGLCRYWKLDLYQLADYAVVASLIGLIIGHIGCFFGGCEYGVDSTLWIATSVPGLVGRFFPITLVEAFLLLILFRKLWKRVIKFHISGLILSSFLIWVGLIKLVTEPFRGEFRLVLGLEWLRLGYLLSLGLIFLGMGVLYAQSKRTLRGDLNDLWLIITSEKRRNAYLSSIRKNWYNHLVNLRIRFSKIRSSKLLSSKVQKTIRRLNVKPTPKNYL